MRSLRCLAPCGRMFHRDLVIDRLTNLLDHLTLPVLWELTHVTRLSETKSAGVGGRGSGDLCFKRCNTVRMLSASVGSQSSSVQRGSLISPCIADNRYDVGRIREYLLQYSWESFTQTTKTLCCRLADFVARLQQWICHAQAFLLRCLLYIMEFVPDGISCPKAVTVIFWCLVNYESIMGWFIHTPPPR